jgi:hypothetical protein
MAWRGFSEDEVRAFLQRTADAMVAGEQERIGLLEEIERLRNYFRQQGYDVDLRQRGAEAGRLTDRIREYAGVQADKASRCASIAEADPDQAEVAFQQAIVQTRLALEQSLRIADLSDPADLDRALRWLHAFHHAMTQQIAAMGEGLVAARRRLG